MHDFTFFLLKNWLPVGIASIVFFLIGLLLAKFIWGRWSQRLTFAVEENLNLASQWNALGSSQRDLFKKLRARWQADRDVWESRLVETETIVAQKDARIAQLTSELSGKGKVVPAEVSLDSRLVAQIESLKAEIRRHQEENRHLKAEAAAPVAPVSLLAGIPMAESSDLESKISDLEKDLIDTHDELHEVRNDYLKQVELVEVLEARLVKPRGEISPAPEGAGTAQLSAILGQRSRDLLRFRSEVSSLRKRNEELQLELTEAKKAEALETELATLRRESESSHTKLAEGDGEFELTSRALKAAQIKIDDRDSDISKLRRELKEREETVETLTGEVASLEERLAGFEVLERRRILLEAELNDVSHEMYDVRTALNHRLDEIGMLEARLDELEPIEKAHADLESELKETRHELSDVRIAYNAKVSEFETKTAEMEELEAIIEDRSSEVSDLSDELRQKRDELRLIKNNLAETEGEFEAITEEASVFTAQINAKDTFLQEQALRINDLEASLSLRYAEMNEVRVQFDGEAKNARYHKSRADQLEAELKQREKEFEASDARVASAGEAIEEARLQIEELTNRLADSEQSVQDLQSSLQILSREKDDTIRELERATQRVAELEEAARDREEHIQSIEQEWRDGKHEAESLERQLARLNIEMEEAKENRQHTQIAVEELEEALKASDDRVLTLSREIETKDSELHAVKAEIQTLQKRLRERDAELAGSREEAESLRTHLEGRLGELRASEENDEEERRKLGAEINSLRKTLESKEEEIARIAANRGGSGEEIEALQSKVEKRGNAIRDLQNEVSKIMMQRSARENEVSMLKEKLNAVERELLKARELTANASASVTATPPSVKDLEAALQQSLEKEVSRSGGLSLDQLGEDSAASARGTTTVAHHAKSDPAADENTIFFEESSVGLEEKEIAKIDELASRVRRSNKLAVTVIGFAGAEGTSDLTESLSARRADAVRERLLERGVPQSKIEVRSAGQDRKFNNWRARRVELVASPIAVAESIN